jgi:hypothetical protein
MNNTEFVRLNRASKVLGLPKGQLNQQLVDLVFSPGNQKEIYKQLFRCSGIVNAAKRKGLSPQDVLNLIERVFLRDV